MKSIFSTIGLGGATAAIKTVANSLNAVFDVVLRPNMRLDEMAEIYSEKLDAIIVAEEKNNNLSYVGGTFNISYLDATSFETSYELYFQNKEKEWVKKEAKSKPQKASFLQKEALTEIRIKKKVSFEINHPEMGVKCVGHQK